MSTVHSRVLVAGWRRLSELQALPEPEEPEAGASSPHSLCVHVLGADRNEGLAVEDTRRVFADAAAELARLGAGRLQLVLTGPAVSRNGDHPSASDVSVWYRTGLHHEADMRGTPRPHLALAFNAGVWGYESWLPSMQLVVDQGVPCIVTSYNLQEAEDDEDLLMANLRGTRWLWEAEGCSSLGGREKRSSVAMGTTLVDSSAWQCFTAARDHPVREEPGE